MITWDTPELAAAMDDVGPERPTRPKQVRHAPESDTPELTPEEQSARMSQASRARWHRQPEDATPCPRCHGAHTQRYGLHRRRQRHFCLDCSRMFTEPRPA
jgi:hypothetical protein